MLNDMSLALQRNDFICRSPPLWISGMLLHLGWPVVNIVCVWSCDFCSSPQRIARQTDYCTNRRLGQGESCFARNWRDLLRSSSPNARRRSTNRPIAGLVGPIRAKLSSVAWNWMGQTLAVRFVTTTMLAVQTTSDKHCNWRLVHNRKNLDIFLSALVKLKMFRHVDYICITCR